MPIRDLQNIFSLGELDPKLLSRANFEGYYKGARTARNVLVLPQGGLRRRFGQEYQFTLENTTSATNITDASFVNGAVLEFSADKSFLIVLKPDGAADIALTVYLDNVLQDTVLGSSVPSTVWTQAQIADCYFLRSNDRVIILHPEVAPHEFKRIADNNWSLVEIAFGNLPTYDYSVLDGVNYRAAGVTFTPSATSGVGITVTASAAFYDASHVGGLFVGNGGVFRITSVNALGTIATGDTVEDFSSVAAIKGVNAYLSSAAWGDYTGGTPAGANRGYPSIGEFFQNRLVLGGVPVNKNLVFFSDAGDLYNFDDSEPLATNGFSIGVGTDGNDEIQDIVGSKVLVCLGRSGLYASSLFLDTPLTAENAFLNKQDESGSSALRSYTIDNQILFVDENGQKINAAQYDLTSGTANVVDASLFSPQLINAPVNTAAYRPDDNNGSYLLVVNSDGSLAAYQSLINQNVQGWTLSTTRGLYKKAIASKSYGYLVVERDVSTGAVTGGSIDNVFTSNSSFEFFSDITSAAQDAANDVAVFSNNGDYLLLGHDTPFYRVALTLNTNASADLDLTFEYLNNAGVWTDFTPMDGTVGFTGNGTIVWDIDNDTPDWFPQDVRKSLNEGSYFPPNTINNDVEKFWIRIQRKAPGPIETAMTVDPSFTNFNNVTEALPDAATDVTLFTVDNEYLLLGHPIAFDTLNLTLNTPASMSIAPTFEFLDTNGAWVNFAAVDGTAGFTVAGSITWNIANLADWGQASVNGVSGLYWIRIKRTEGLAITSPIENTLFLNIATTPIEDTISVNTEKQLHVERINFDIETDDTLITTSNAAGLVTGLGHLQGCWVYAVVDGVPEGPFIVDAAGQITVSTESDSVEVGFNYRPSFIPMPVVGTNYYSQNLYNPKLIKGMFVDFYESLGVVVNGFSIPELALNQFALDQPPVPVTDYFEVSTMAGWDPRVEIEISQELPLPMTIIGVGYKLEIS